MHALFWVQLICNEGTVCENAQVPINDFDLCEIPMTRHTKGKVERNDPFDNEMGPNSQSPMRATLPTRLRAVTCPARENAEFEELL